MSKVVFCAGFLGLVCVSATANWLDPPRELLHTLIVPGSHWAMDVEGLPTQDWFGVYVTGDGAVSLNPATVALVDEEDLGGSPRKKVVASPSDHLLVLIHGIPDAREGRIESRFSTTLRDFGFDGMKPLELGFFFPLDDRNVRKARSLMVLGTVARSEYDGVPFTSELNCVVADGDVEQVVLSDAPSYYPPMLVLAADVDRDGKTDLILKRSHESGAFELTLWLSSAAKEGELLGLGAFQRETGC